MKLIDKENGRSLVEVKEDGDGKEYASKGVAGTALGLGIAGTALALFNGGLFGNGLFGSKGNSSPNVAIANAKSSDGGFSGGHSNEQYLERKECSDVVSLTNAIWQQAYNAQGARCEDRSVINQEMFGIYSAMRNGFDVLNEKQNKNAFDLYKYSRDNKDELSAQIGDLKCEVSVLKATRPYQDALIQCDIRRTAEHADFNLWRRTCRMIQGEVVLPNTPVVTGYGSYNNCGCNSNIIAPAIS